MIKHAMDLSNYSGFLSLEQAAALRTHVEYMIVRAGPQSGQFEGATWIYTRQQLLALRDAGMQRLDIYGYLNFQRDAKQQVDEYLKIAEGFDIGCLWLDCEAIEAYDQPANPQQAVAFIQQAVDACAGRIACGIYTAPWWWEARTGNTQQFKDLPNWTATNDKDGNVALNRWYGGWTKPFLEQFNLDTTVEGITVDINAYEEADPNPPRPDLHIHFLEVGGSGLAIGDEEIVEETTTRYVIQRRVDAGVLGQFDIVAGGER